MANINHLQVVALRFDPVVDIMPKVAVGPL